MKKLKGLLAMLVLTLGVSACTPGALTDVYEDEEKIASDSNAYSRINSVLHISDQGYEASFGRFKGMETIWTYDAEKEQAIEFQYLISVESGRLKLVLITPDGAVTTLVEITSETTMEEAQYGVIQVTKGENRIKIVGEDVENADIELTIYSGEFQKETEEE